MKTVTSIGGSPKADLHEAYQKAVAVEDLRGYVLIYQEGEDIKVSRNWHSTRDLIGVYALETESLVRHHRESL